MRYLKTIFNLYIQLISSSRGSSRARRKNSVDKATLRNLVKMFFFALGRIFMYPGFIAEK